MAKQRGVVQLSGRVDNLCYYQQKKIRGGLVRRINLAMGERVKTGSEYTRLRLANSYFGACSMCASAIIQMTGTRADFLHLGDRQAILTKNILEFQKRQHTESVGSIVIFEPTDSLLLSPVYESIVKNKMSNFFPGVPYSVSGVAVGTQVDVNISSVELEYYCQFNKCIGVEFTVVTGCFLYGTGKMEDSQKFHYPDCGRNSRSTRYSWLVGDGDLDLEGTVSTHNDAANFVIIIAMPIVEQVGGRNVKKLTGSTARLIGVEVV